MKKNQKKDISKLADSELPPIKEDFRETYQWKIFRIMSEFVEGFNFVTDFHKAVTIFGSTQMKEDDIDYKKARKLGNFLAKEGFTTITGGGPGIMEAANRGAYEAGGDSIGINIQLKEGERANDYLTRSIGFYYFFARKVMLSYSSYGYVFFPGGFGTLDEFFEIITLIQTNKLPRKILVIAVGKDYWEPFFNWLKDNLLEKYKTIQKENLEIFKLVDTPEEAIKIIKENYNKNKEKKNKIL